MLLKVSATVAAISFISSVAFAQPTLMTDEEMDSQVAGANVVTKNGNNIWTVTSLSPLDGYNNGGHGKTEVTAPGLLNAVGAGGLGVTGL